jgi:hypothetical protein
MLGKMESAEGLVDGLFVIEIPGFHDFRERIEADLLKS